MKELKRIYEPDDIKEMPDRFEREPNVEIIEGVLRLHFHPEGVSFGMVDPRDPRFAMVIRYDAARRLMLEAATEAMEKPECR